MDRSTTEATDHPQGDAKLLELSLEILRQTKPNATRFEQIHLLRRTIECADGYCPISTWGVKKVSEHITDRRGKFFADDCGIDYCDYKVNSVRAVNLLAPYSFDEKESIHWDEWAEHKTRFVRVNIFLLLDEDCNIVAIKSLRHIAGEEILPAHKIDVLKADDPFLLDIMNHPKNSDGSKKLILNAVQSLSQSIYWAYDRAQKRINRFSKGSANLNLISHQMTSVWTQE